MQNFFDNDSQNSLKREVIAKHLGYNSVSGASDTSIATLNQCGLLEKVSAKESRVSDLALDILVPENEQKKQLAINAAALNPKIYSMKSGKISMMRLLQMMPCVLF